MIQTTQTLIEKIYLDNESHIEFMENMNGGDCDCHIHITLNTIFKYCDVNHTELV